EVEAEYKKATSKEELLKIWDKSTEEINALWPKIPVSRFQENELFWGQYEGLVYTSILYLIDNEIHHRGQGYVYLRSLGIEPPAFWDRN
ncbi:MAG TPA: DinB family protein, partial [Ignavibacteriaceae bacterium]